jgi:PKD domain
MRRNVVVFGIFLLFLCSSSVPSMGNNPYGQPLTPENTKERGTGVDIPTWYQGDEWTYTIDPLYFSSPNGSFSGTIQNFKQRVVGIVGDTYKVSLTGTISGTLIINGTTGTVSGSITGTSYMRQSDLAEETTELQSQGTIIVLFVPLPYNLNLVMTSSPALEVFDFPLAVGEQWQLEGNTTTTGSFSITGIYQQSLNGSQWVNEVVSCIAEESISVPAGVFDCFTVSHGNTMVWYSSQAGNIVKSTIDQSNENMTVQMTQSLKSFSRAAQPLTVSEDIEPAVVAPGVSIVVSGQVTNTGTGAPVQNGAISLTIPSTGGSWSTTTDTSGQYSISIVAPTMHDDTDSGRETGSGGVVVSCSGGGLSGYRVQSLVTVTDTAPAAPSIDGASQGKIRVSYDYTVSAVDPESDDVLYFIDWGDTTSSGWVGPSVSGEVITVSHTFTKKGTYTITVKAKDVYSAESAVGTLQVTMPKDMSAPFFMRFFERFPHAFPILRHLLGC